MGDIQKRILELLSERGWSIYKLAQETGIHQTTIYDWFNEKKFTPSRKSLEAVCAALGISLAEFSAALTPTLWMTIRSACSNSLKRSPCPSGR